MNVLISKLITAFFIGVFAVIVFLPLTMNYARMAVSRQAAMLGGVSAFLAIVLFLIVFMGLQMATSFVSSKIVDVLSPFPISKQDVSTIVFLCFVRIFDIPLVAAVVIFLSAYFVVGGSALGGLVAVVGIITAEIFALALTTVLAKFFYSKVASAGGRSRWQALLRFVYMLVWILPTFAAYFIINFATAIVQSFASLIQSLSSFSHVVVLIYPFCYAFLISAAAFSGTVDYGLLTISSVASAAYTLFAYYSLRWVTRTVRNMGVGPMPKGPRETVKDTFIKPAAPWLGIIRKDLRVASRAPSYATLFFLPIIQTVGLALSFSSLTQLSLINALAILTGMALLTLLLPPTLASIEGLASAYMRHLPLGRTTLITAKTVLSTFTYVLSLVALTIVALFMRKDFSLILTYGLVFGFSVAAAVMLELTILTRMFWKEGFAVGNIYSRISTYIMIVIPGYALASVPIITAFAASLFEPHLVLALFLVVAVAEFAAMLTTVKLQH